MLMYWSVDCMIKTKSLSLIMNELQEWNKIGTIFINKPKHRMYCGDKCHLHVHLCKVLVVQRGGKKRSFKAILFPTKPKIITRQMIFILWAGSIFSGRNGNLSLQACSLILVQHCRPKSHSYNEKWHKYNISIVETIADFITQLSWFKRLKLLVHNCAKLSQQNFLFGN